MAAEIITKEDLEQFKSELFNELKKLSYLPISNTQSKKWMKSAEVKKLLNISTGTLFHLRATGKVKYEKLGGTYFFDAEHIHQILNGKKG